MNTSVAIAIPKLRKMGVQSNLALLVLVLLDEGEMFLGDLVSLSESNYHNIRITVVKLKSLGLISSMDSPRKMVELTTEGRALMSSSDSTSSKQPCIS